MRGLSMTSLITSLHQSLEVIPSDDGQVKVTVSLPSELLNDFIGLLESLSGFVGAINHQKHLVRLRDASDHTKTCHQNKILHHKRLVKEYDRHISQGLSRN